MSGLWSFRGGASTTPAGVSTDNPPQCMAVMMLSAFDPSYGVGSEPSVATATATSCPLPRTGERITVPSKRNPSATSYTSIADTESEEEELLLEDNDGVDDVDEGKWWSHLIDGKEGDDSSVSSASSSSSSSSSVDHDSSRGSTPEVLGPHPDDGVEAILSRLRKVPVTSSSSHHHLANPRSGSNSIDGREDADALRAAREIIGSGQSPEPRPTVTTAKSRDRAQLVDKSNIDVIKRVEEKKKVLSSFAVSQSSRAGSRTIKSEDTTSDPASLAGAKSQQTSKEKPDWSEIQKARRIERDRARAEAKAERELDERILTERKRLQSELQRLRSTELQFEATRNAIEKGKKGSIPGVPHCPPQPIGLGTGLVPSKGSQLTHSVSVDAAPTVKPHHPQAPIVVSVPRTLVQVPIRSTAAGLVLPEQQPSAYSFESPDKHFIPADTHGDSPPSPPGTAAPSAIPIQSGKPGAVSAAKGSKKSKTSQSIHRDATAPSSSAETGNHADACSLSSENLPVHQAMAARREEREKARLLLKQKYEASREQRYAQAMAEVEAEERRLLDEKKKAALHRKKLKEEAAAAEERKRLEEMRKAELKQKATAFNRSRLLKWFGVLPWKSFVALRRSQSEVLSKIADAGRRQLCFRRWHLFLRQQQSLRQVQSVLREIQMVNVVKRCWMRNLFQRWKGFQQQSLYEVHVVSVEQYKRFLLRRWNKKALRTIEKREAQQMQLAERHERFRTIRRAFSGWQQVVRSEKMQRQRDEVRSKLWHRAQAVLQDGPRTGL